MTRELTWSKGLVGLAGQRATPAPEADRTIGSLVDHRRLAVSLYKQAETAAPPQACS
jgi:hypothetical protein